MNWLPGVNVLERIREGVGVVLQIGWVLTLEEEVCLVGVFQEPPHHALRARPQVSPDPAVQLLDGVLDGVAREAHLDELPHRGRRRRGRGRARLGPAAAPRPPQVPRSDGGLRLRRGLRLMGLSVQRPRFVVVNVGGRGLSGGGGGSGAAETACLLGGDRRGQVLRDGERGRLQFVRREDGLDRGGVRGLGQQPLDQEDLLGVPGESRVAAAAVVLHGLHRGRPDRHGLPEDLAQRVLVGEEHLDGLDDGQTELLLAQEG